MLTHKTLKYVRQTINHPYVGLKILPLVGDFCGHATNVTKSLYNEGELTSEEYDEMLEMIFQVERHQNETALQELLSIFKHYAGWA